MPMELVHASLADPIAAPLLADLEREYVDRYGPGATREMTRYGPELFAASAGGAFIMLLDDGEAVAGGGFMRTDAATAEIKRMWTRGDRRRQGLARRVLAGLEEHARRIGYRSILLTTGWAQPEAVALYLALGYEPGFDPEGDLRAAQYLGFTKILAADEDGAP